MIVIEAGNKKVVFFLESLSLGGIGRLTLLLAEYFADQGYDVNLFLAKTEGDYLSQVPAGINVVNKKNTRVLFSLHSVGSYLKNTKPDALIAANERINIVALLAKILYRSKTRIIISTHINNSEQIRHEKRGAAIYLYRKAALLAARLVYKWADHVVAVSKGVADDMRKLFKLSPERIKVIYNPIVTPGLKVKMKAPAEHAWFRQPGGPVILGIGRLAVQKDFFTLIDAFVEIRKTIPEARLIILGEGEERKPLENKISALNIDDYVSMPGFVNNPYSYLYNSSVFVLSSAWEGFGNVLVEAMATGTPVVATDCPSGPAEILEYGKYGPLVPVGDAKGLARSVIAVLKDQPDPGFLQNRANDFTVEKAFEKYQELINS